MAVIPRMFRVVFADKTSDGMVEFCLSVDAGREDAIAFVRSLVPESARSKACPSYSRRERERYSTVSIKPSYADWGYQNVRQFYDNVDVVADKDDAAYMSLGSGH